MPTRRQWTALCLSGLASIACAVALAAWWRARPNQTLQLRPGDPRAFAERRPEDRGLPKVDDPRDPREWKYWISPERARFFFSFTAQDTRMVYDPWTYSKCLPDQRWRLDWREHPSGFVSFDTNSLGLREDRELPARVDLAILAAGDSHTCGVCLNSESWPNRLEARLAERRPGQTVEVLNAGLGGYSFHSYFGTFLRFRDFAPRVFVVAVYGGNDFAEMLPLWTYFARREWKNFDRDTERLRDRALELEPNQVGQVYSSLITFRAWPQMQETMPVEAALLCGEMQAQAERMGSRLVVLFIPSAFDFEYQPKVFKQDEMLELLSISEEDAGIQRWLGDRFLAEVGRLGIAVVDLRATFEAEPSPPYWRGDLHLNLRGHELAAQALEPVVERLLAEPPPPAR